jgi:hypothetical protein
MTALPGERAAVRAADLRCVNFSGEKLMVLIHKCKLQANLARSSLKKATLAERPVGCTLRTRT